MQKSISEHEEKCVSKLSFFMDTHESALNVTCNYCDFLALVDWNVETAQEPVIAKRDCIFYCIQKKKNQKKNSARKKPVEKKFCTHFIHVGDKCHF